MTSRLPIPLILSLFLALAASAETAVRDDGRKVTLKDDGSWELVSDEVYATTQSGQRVILKPDGTWQKVVGTKALSVAPQVKNVPAENRAATTNSVPYVNNATSSTSSTNANRVPDYFAIRHIVVEKVELKRGGSSKAAVLDHRSIVTLDILKPVESDDLAIDIAKLDARFFTLSDNRGGNYPVISVQPLDDNAVVVVARGAPSRLFSRVKHYELKIDKALLDAASDSTLIYDYRDVESVVRQEFSY